MSGPAAVGNGRRGGVSASLLVRLLSRSWPGYLGLTGLWLALRTTVLAAGLLLQAVFDTLSGAERAGLTVWSLIAVLAAAEAAKLVLWYGVILSRLEPHFTYQIRSALQVTALRGVLRRPAGQALTCSRGDAVSRFGTDADEVGVFAIWSASSVSRIVIAAGALAIMLAIDVVVTMGVVLPVVAVVIAGRALGRPLVRYQRASREAAAEVSTVVGEAVGGVQAIKVACAEQRIVERLRRANAERLRLAVREAVLTAVQSSLFTSTAALGTGCVLLLGAASMRTSALTVGDLALFVFYIQFITEAVAALGMFFARYRKAAVSVHRLAELAGGEQAVAAKTTTYLRRVPPEPASAPESGSPLQVLQTRGLTFHYPSSARGIRDIDLTLRAGTVTVVTGRVGSGKSTLLQVLLGLLTPERGEVLWNGTPLHDPGTFLVPPRSSYVPQVPRLFSGTIRENILLGLDLPPAALAKAVSRAVLDHDVLLLEQGLDTVIGPRGLRLSGGQVQRVAAARMVVRDAELMVFDDLSNSLDVATELELWDRLLHRNGSTVLAVSHRAPVLRRADQVIVLTDGEVTAAGTLEETLECSAEMRRLREEYDDV